MKKFFIVLLVLAMLMMLAGCGKTRTVTCDVCGADIEIAEDSNITDDWIVFCEECEAKIGCVVEPGN